jgi:hypothetical protein
MDALASLGDFEFGENPMLIPGYGGGGPPRVMYAIFGFLVGAVIGAVIVLAADASPQTQLLGVLFCGTAGAFLCWHLSPSDANARRPIGKSQVAAWTNNSAAAKDLPHACYPLWLVVSFFISLGALAIGLLSVLYIVLAGFSLTALAITYLIPFGLTALYYLLGAAEQCTAE